MTDFPQALQSLRPGARWAMDGDKYSGLTWLSDDMPKPTEEELTAEIARLRAEFTAKQYQRDRAKEYPPLGDQLDALFHAGVFPPEMAAKIQAVKDKFPKG